MVDPSGLGPQNLVTGSTEAVLPNGASCQYPNSDVCVTLTPGLTRKRFSVEQIVAVLKQAELGVPVAELIRQVGITEQTLYRWKKQYKGLETDQVRQLKQLQDENAHLKHVVAPRSTSARKLRLIGHDRAGPLLKREIKSQPRGGAPCQLYL